IAIAASVSGAFANRLALVRMPSLCPARIPALTPGVRPKSSPLTTGVRRHSRFKAHHLRCPLDVEHLHRPHTADLDLTPGRRLAAQLPGPQHGLEEDVTVLRAGRKT